MTSERSISPPKPIGIAVVEHAGQYLVGVRAEGTVLAGYAEFPGGKCEPGETAEACAVRECLEETGLSVESVGLIDRIAWDYPHGQVDLSFVRCLISEDAQPRSPFRWVPVEELGKLRFPEANAEVIAKLLASLSERRS